MDYFTIKEEEGDKFIGYDEKLLNGVWKEMESLVDEGKIKSIGLANFNIQKYENIEKNARIKPSVVQFENHPYNQQNELVEEYIKRGVAVTAYQSLGAGKDVPGHGFLLKDPVLIEIGKKYNKSSAQVALRWAVQRGCCIIPKSTNADRIKQNYDIFDFELSKEDMDKIKSLDTHVYKIYIIRQD